MKLLVKALLIILFSWTYSSTAYANSSSRYCVACKNPSKIYYCNVRILKSDGSAARLGSLCVSKITTNFRHQSCAITKINPDICEGRKVTYLYNPKETITRPTNASVLPYASKTNKKPAPAVKDTSISDIEQITPENYEVKPKRTIKPQKVAQKQQYRRRAHRKREKSTLDKINDELNKTDEAIRRATQRAIRNIESLFD